MLALYLVSAGAGFVGLILILIVWELRHALQPGKMWIVILTPDRKWEWHFRATKGKQVDVGKTKYTLSSECIIRTGRWNIPTIFYVEGVPAPINFGNLQFDGELTSADYFEAIRSHVARDIIHSLESSPQQIMLVFAIIVSVVVILASAFVYVNLNKEIKKNNSPQQTSVANAQ